MALYKSIYLLTYPSANQARRRATTMETNVLPRSQIVISMYDTSVFSANFVRKIVLGL